MVDADYLEQLRADADEVRKDLAEREQTFDDDYDPIASHDAVMAATRSLPPAVVHKTHVTPPRQFDRMDSNNDQEPPLFSDEQLDVVAEVLGEFRGELRNEIDVLKERIANLEGQLSMLTTLLNGNGNNRPDSNTAIENDKILRLPR
jgi:hypothetical protein